MESLGFLNINFSDWLGNWLPGCYTMAGWYGLLAGPQMMGGEVKHISSRATHTSEINCYSSSEVSWALGPRCVWAAALPMSIRRKLSAQLPQWQKKRNHPNAETMPEFLKLWVLSPGSSPSSSIFVLGSDSCSSPIPQSAVTHSRGQLNPMLSHRAWTVIVSVCLSFLLSFIHSILPSFPVSFLPSFLPCTCQKS